MEPMESGKQENEFVNVTRQRSPTYDMEQCYTDTQARALKALGG